jgi:hypothetical protein
MEKFSIVIVIVFVAVLAFVVAIRAFPEASPKSPRGSTPDADAAAVDTTQKAV